MITVIYKNGLYHFIIINVQHFIPNLIFSKDLEPDPHLAQS